MQKLAVTVTQAVDEDAQRSRMQTDLLFQHAAGYGFRITPEVRGQSVDERRSAKPFAFVPQPRQHPFEQGRRGYQ